MRAIEKGVRRLNPDLSRAMWRKSSRSNGQNGACVEVAFVKTATAVRDSKNPTGPAMIVQPSAFAALVESVKDGRLA